jgi:hypothetical protein
MIAASLAVYNGLIEFDNAGNPTGELLESWDTKPGAVEWTFNVRKGVKFSNGKELDADDILYSIAIHRGETKSPAKGILEQITTARVNIVNADLLAKKRGLRIVETVVPVESAAILTDIEVAVGTGSSKFSSAVDSAGRISVAGTVKNGAQAFLTRIGNFDVELAIEVRSPPPPAPRRLARPACTGGRPVVSWPGLAGPGMKAGHRAPVTPPPSPRRARCCSCARPTSPVSSPRCRRSWPRPGSTSPS